MKRLLRIDTCGIKNISKSIVIDFSNSNFESGIKNVNNVKGVFGFNGAGKTALITSVDYYKKIVAGSNFLLQNETVEKLDKLINKRIKYFDFSIYFEITSKSVLKHRIKVEKDNIEGNYIISEEGVYVSSRKSLNDSFKAIFEKNKNEININRIDNEINIFNTDDLKYNSILFKYMLYLSKKYENSEINLNESETIMTQLFSNIRNIYVCLSEDDEHKKYFRKMNILNERIDDLYVDDDVIEENEYELYTLENKKLEKFIRVFKPELRKIELIPDKDHDLIHLRRIFHYKDYEVEYEFESSGIKQLVKLFSFLIKCANGGIVFIDEIDTNINSVYFEKLVLFFKVYGEGQLIFTTHNLEAMNSLKDQSKAIVVLGDDGNIDTWVSKGNRSPIKDYIGGFFLNSPMNVEDFDFVNVFMGE